MVSDLPRDDASPLQDAIGCLAASQAGADRPLIVAIVDGLDPGRSPEGNRHRGNEEYPECHGVSVGVWFCLRTMRLTRGTGAVMLLTCG